MMPGESLQHWYEITAVCLALLHVKLTHKQRILVVGLGAGTVLSFLGRYAPHVEVDVVEPSEEFIHLAQCYFGLHVDSESFEAYRSRKRVHGMSWTNKDAADRPAEQRACRLGPMYRHLRTMSNTLL